MTRIRQWALALACALHSACSAGRAQPTEARPYPAPDVLAEGQTLAVVGEVKLTTAEIERRMRAQSPFVQASLRDAERRAQFAANEVKSELLAQEGWRRKLYEDPQILAELRRAIAQRVLKDEMTRLQGSMELSEAEMQAAYQKREAQYNKPAEVRVSHIAKKASTPAEKAAAKKELEQTRASLVKEQKTVQNAALAFAEVAKKLSQDEATRNGGGDLGFMTKDAASNRFGAEHGAKLFEINVGDQLLVESDSGVELMMKTGMRREVVRTLEQVKPQLRAQLLGEKRNQLFEGYVEELRKKTGATMDLELAKQINFEGSGSGHATPAAPAEDEDER